MRERESNVLSLLEDKTNKYARKIALGMKTQFGWKELTYDGLGLMSRRLAAHLMNDLGLQRGEKLAILSESKPEYGACVFASVIAGLITVPLDIKLTIYELESILSDCLPTVLLVSQSYIDKALKLKELIPSLKHIIVMDEQPYNDEIKSIYTIPNNYTCKWRHRSRKSVVFIIYTSGTTGAPKGVETTFGNMLTQLHDLKNAFNKILPFGDVRILSILPMNHLFEMTVGFSTFLNLGFSVYYTHNLKPKDILNLMRDRKINFMVVVPAFLKLLKTGLETEVKASSNKFYQKIFPVLYHIAKFVPFITVKRLMFPKIHRCFGGAFRGCVSGGAPLDLSVAKFFQRVGIQVYEVYGLTETSPIATINFERHRDLRSVGKPLPSYEAKTDPETGEFLLRGPSVMKGYHNQPDLTREAVDDEGWFHTGDIAKIDDKGRVYITGRIKNMIVLSGGKKVFPEEVEAVLEKSDLFSEVCVLGVSREGGAKDGTEDIMAVVVPADDIMDKYDEATLDKMLKAEVKKMSLHLTPYKRPINIKVLKHSLPRTATRKVQRKKVKELIHVG